MTTPTRSMARMAHSPPSPPPSAARLGQDSVLAITPAIPPAIPPALSVTMGVVLADAHMQGWHAVVGGVCAVGGVVSCRGAGAGGGMVGFLPVEDETSLDPGKNWIVWSKLVLGIIVHCPLAEFYA